MANRQKGFLVFIAAMIAFLMLFPTIAPLSSIVSAEAPADPSTVKPSLLEIIFIDVGQGDCILIKSPDGKSMLIDAGESGSAGAVIDALKLNSVARLDYVIATHAHSDHIGGMVRVIREIPVGTVYDTTRTHTTSSYLLYLEAVKASEAKFQRILAGTSFKLGMYVTINFLWPLQDTTSGLNEASAVILIKYGNFDALFMADTDNATVQSLLKIGSISKVELLKVPHHGSGSSSSNELLKVASAELAVIQSGAGNSFGHPDDATLVRIKANGARILRTDVEGSIKITSDGTRWWATSTKGANFTSSSIQAPAGNPALLAQYYVGSANSTVFHLSGCEIVTAISAANLVKYASREDALSKGKRSCKICNP